MRVPVTLYIGGQEVEFNSPPEILYTYEETDVSNPTAIKNSFSKTLTIEGTQKNNDLFGHFWRLDRRTVGGGDGIGVAFNALNKVPFNLYVNAELYESGYVRLDNVTNENGKIEYSISLYGGLGSFFSNLEYNSDNGNKLKLSDLAYIDGSDDELDFVINKATVREAWDGLTNTAATKWNVINFVPAYNGVSDSLDASKVLIDIASTDLQTSARASGATYDPYNGYVLMELDKDLTEWETRDLRSYLQRPAIKVSSVISACCNPSNNGGYTVDLDPDFFNSGNTDWADTWMTLPMLTDIVYEPSDIEIGTVTVGEKNGDDYSWYIPIEISTTKIPLNQIQLNVELSLTSLLGETTNLFNSHITSKRNVFGTSTYFNYSSLFVQLVGYNSNGIPVAASNSKNITNVIDYNGAKYYGDVNTYEGNLQYGYNNKYTSILDMPVDLVDSFWRYDSGSGRHKLSEGISLSLEGSEDVATVRLLFRRCAKVDFVHSGNERYEYRTALYFSELSDNTNTMFKEAYTLENPLVTSNDLTVWTNDGIRSNSLITKKMLLNTDYSPCDFLLSYCKTYGLYFIREKEGKKVQILTRNNFYHNFTIDLESLIDRGNELTITPVCADRQWFDFKIEQVDGEFNTQYETTTDTVYGMKRVNTNYAFNPEALDLLDGNIFKGAIECIEKSPYYLKTLDNDVPVYFGQTIKYDLYNGSDTYPVEIAHSYDTVAISPYKWYDCHPKIQLHTEDNSPSDGSNVLVYFNGWGGNTSQDGGNFTYSLTDDVAEMLTLNDGKPCYLYTTNNNGTKAYQYTAIPLFGRYKGNEAGYVERSLDFGQPRQLYLKSLTMSDATEDSTVYNRYWKNYISDLYDKDSKVLRCYVRIAPVRNGGAFVMSDKVSPEWLRYFYWFDNSLWRLNAIEDWNVSSFGTTLMEFIRVQDITNYTTAPSPSIPTYKYPKLKFSSVSSYISQTGQTVQITVDANQSWTASCDTSGCTITPTTGTGNTVVTGGTVSVQNDIITLTIPKYWDEYATDDTRVITVTATGASTGSIDTISFIQPLWKPNVSLSPKGVMLPWDGGNIRLDWSTWNQSDTTFSIMPPVQTSTEGIPMVITRDTRESLQNITPYRFIHYVSIGENTGTTVVGAYWMGGLYRGATQPFFYEYETLRIVQLPEEMVWGVDGKPSDYELIGDSAMTVIVPIPNVKVVAKPSWISYEYGTTTDSASTKIVFSCDENEGYEREGTVILWDEAETTVYSQVKFTMRQLGEYYPNPSRRAQIRRKGYGYVYPVGSELSYNASEQSMRVDVEDTGIDSPWSASTTSNWITLSVSGGTGDGYFYIKVDENDTEEPRNAYVRVMSNSQENTVIVHQSDVAGGGASLIKVKPKNVNVGFASGSSSVTLTNAVGQWTASTNDSWISFETSSGGTGVTSFAFAYAENSGDTERTGTIQISNGIETTTITVKQEGFRLIFNVSPNTLNFNSTGGSQTITVETNGDFTVS